MIEKLNERITIEKSTVVTDKVGNHRNTMGEIFHLLCLRLDLSGAGRRG